MRRCVQAFDWYCMGVVGQGEIMTKAKISPSMALYQACMVIMCKSLHSCLPT